MIKTILAAGALALAVAAPAAAQMSAPAAGGALPKCSATVHDSCDQSMTTQKYALSAAQADATGGVGDRKSDQAAKGSMAPPMHKGMKHKGMMHKHHMMTKTKTMSMPATPAESTPQ